MSVVEELESVWLRRYLTLQPVLQKLKRLSAAEQQDGAEDYLLVVYQLKTAVEAHYGEMQRVAETAVKGIAPLDAALVYARWRVICGDLYRYLDRFQKPRGDFRRSADHYRAALRSNGNDGKAFSGLYIVTAADRSQVLLSAVYLLKSMTVTMPFNETTDAFTSFARRVGNAPSELKDVPFAARSCVAATLDLVSLCMDGMNTHPRCPALVRAFTAALPGKDLTDSPGLIPWDSLLAVLIVATLDRVGDIDHLVELLKLLIGRALRFNRVLPIMVVADYASRRLRGPVFTAIKREATRSLTRQHFTAELAQKGLAIDHLIGVQSTGKASELEEADVAAARVCQLCRVPWGTSAQRALTPELTSPRPAGSKPVVVLDAANLACRAGEAKRVATAAAVEAAYNYWTHRGHTVKVVVSERHARRGNRRAAMNKTATGIQINLDEVYEIFDASSILAIPPQNHDDSYMLEYALRVDGVLVSNDRFRDWVAKHRSPAEAETWIRSHVIGYTFADGMYMSDPDFKLPDPLDTASLMN